MRQNEREQILVGEISIGPVLIGQVLIGQVLIGKVFEADTVRVGGRAPAK
jgi:hypothetical protein